MPQACNFIKKETLAQMFSCEFCGISKNTFFSEHLWETASLYLTKTFMKDIQAFLSDKDWNGNCQLRVPKEDL